MESNNENENFLKNNAEGNQSASDRNEPREENPDMTDQGTLEGYNSSDPDKYLALEQEGVTFTPDSRGPLLNSDTIEDGGAGNSDTWNGDEQNTRNSDAFNQDEFLLEDNLELDEEKSQSISSDNDNQ